MPRRSPPVNDGGAWVPVLLREAAVHFQAVLQVFPSLPGGLGDGGGGDRGAA